MLALLQGMSELDKVVESDQVQVNYQYISIIMLKKIQEAIDDFLEINRDSGAPITFGMVDMIRKIWADPEIKATYARRSEFIIQDTAEQ